MDEADRRLGGRHGQHEHREPWPTRSLSTTEKATKLMLTARSISSIDI